ncbi:hypothetical protein BDF22DRAFT_745204 [Syncephalis plumigaleata]|nr:hypothetical protein BDF22DRAFT_745204 [Syncephalis plumigaleata]
MPTTVAKSDSVLICVNIQLLPVELIALLLNYLAPDTGVQLANVNRRYRSIVKAYEHYWQQACCGLTFNSSEDGVQSNWYARYIQLKRRYWAWHHTRRTEYTLHPSIPLLWLTAYELVTANEQWAVVASGRPLRLFLIPIERIITSLSPVAIELALPTPPRQPRLVARHLLAPCWGVLSHDYLVVRTPRDRFFPSIPPCLLVWRISDWCPLRWVPLGFADTRRTCVSGRWLLSTLGGSDDNNNSSNNNNNDEDSTRHPRTTTEPSNGNANDDDASVSITNEEHHDYWRPVATFSAQHRVVFLPNSTATSATRIYSCYLSNHLVKWAIYELQEEEAIHKVQHGTFGVNESVKTIDKVSGLCDASDLEHQHTPASSRYTTYVVVHHLSSHDLSQILPGYRAIYPSSGAAVPLVVKTNTREKSFILLVQETTGILVTTNVDLNHFYQLNLKLPPHYSITALFPSVILLSTRRFRYLFNMKTMQWQTIDDGSSWVSSTLAGSGRCVYVKGNTLRVMDYRAIELPKPIGGIKGAISKLSWSF